MKRWVKRTIAILLLGAAGTAALLLRPAFMPCTVTHFTSEGELFNTPAPENAGEAFEFDYCWNLQNHPDSTYVFGDLEPEAFSLLHAACWNLRLRAANGYMELDDSSSPSQFRAKTPLSHTEVEFFVLDEGYMYCSAPEDDSIRPLNSLVLICDVTVHRPFLARPVRSIATQRLLIDLDKKKVQLSIVPPRPEDIPDSMWRKPLRLIRNGVPSGLPGNDAGE